MHTSPRLTQHVPLVLGRRAALLLPFTVGLTLTACGGGETTESATPSGETRVVTDVEDKEVTVPVSPQRVITLSEPTLDAALALGVTPVGTVAGRGQSRVPNYLAEKVGDVPLLGTVSQLDYEAIGATEPDLILVDGTSVNNRPDVLEILNQIAPVVFTGYAGGPWELNFDNVAEALNRAEEGAKVKSDYEALITETAAALAENYSDKTFSIVRWQGSGPSLILKELPAGQVLEDLGLARPASQDRLGRGHSEPVSLENLATIDADYMFLGTLGGASQENPNSDSTADLAGAAEALKRAEQTSGFTDLQAYKDDHIILVDGSQWTSTGGPLLLQGIVTDVKKALLDSAQ
ncbi:iron-siderophore ABC transporter substrate-binding protein [Rothia nasimurium]|uniref:iron-siderophore ABC transporter substrate-binding protein n=1 Tax=Rothia nasimurium TaxID=85336 RepID=UPI002DD62BDE|nr:iron-siderophore ABC transporter substrate-binding protein [Rothia nasimurium]